ncbi:MAG: YIP1 family protein [Terriglobales bacterium]
MATVPLPPPQPSQESAPLSEGQRLLYTFFAPSRTFTDLKRNASWWAPYLIIAIVSVLFVSVVSQKVGFRKVVDNLIQLQPKQADRIDSLPAARRETVIQQQVAFTKILSYAIPVIALIIYAILAGVLFGTLKFAANADLKYKHLFAVVVYSRLPELLMSLLAILSLLAGVSVDAFNIQNPAATNPGYFLDPSASPVLRALLTPFDVFTIWSMVLIAIGITCIGKVKRGTAYAVVFGWFAIMVLARVGLAAATS